MTVWGDGVFLLNGILDGLLLAGAVRLRGGVPRRGRLLAASALGGAVSLLSLYLPALPWAILAPFGMLPLAYGLSAEALRCGAVFLGLSAALCGLQEALARLFSLGFLLRRGGVLLLIPARLLLASAALLYGACAGLSGLVRPRARRLLSTQVTAAGRTVCFRSLLDTGSFLRDPLSGRAVLLADAGIAHALLGLDRAALRRPEESLAVLARSEPALRPRLIPYRAVGGDGLLLGVRCETVRLGGTLRQGAILAFSPDDVSDDGSYHGLTGGSP